MPLRRVPQFILHMDARAWRSIALTFVLFGGVGVVFLFGASIAGLKDPAQVEAWLGAGVHGPWALPASVLSFAALAFLGVPQFMLIAAAVVAFGPWAGFAYSWIGTMVSSLVGFALGRRFGAKVLREHGGRSVASFTDMVGRNGFTASLVVRLVPFAPFIVVNMAAGVTPMRIRDFVAGTTIGIVPKIALTAFAGHTVVRAMTGGGTGQWLTLAGAGAVWIGAGLLGRAWIKRREAVRAAQTATLPDGPPKRT